MWSCKWDHKWRHSMAPTSCMLHKQWYMHARAWTRASIRTQICNTYCFSMATMIRERASMLRYTYIACLVLTVNKFSEIMCNCICRCFSQTDIIAVLNRTFDCWRALMTLHQGILQSDLHSVCRSFFMHYCAIGILVTSRCLFNFGNRKLGS